MPDTTSPVRPFIVRSFRGTYLQSPRLLVQWREVRRTKRVIAGLFAEVEHDSWDKNQVSIVTAWDRQTEGAPEPILADGRRGRSGEGQTVSATTDGVKTVARRIKDEDAAVLDQIDATIRDHEQIILGLRAERKALVAKAWRRAKPIEAYDVRPGKGEHRRDVA